MYDPQKRHYEVISYYCASKLAYFVEHDIGYEPSKFQCSRNSESNFMERGGTPPPPLLIGFKCGIKSAFKIDGLTDL